jgi:chromosome segregation ATPase
MLGIVLVSVVVLVDRYRTKDSPPASPPLSNSDARSEGERAVLMQEISLDGEALSPMSGSRVAVDPAAAAAFAEAQARYAAAQSAVAEAQARIDESERELEDLERFVEDLEARGEDPAEHAEEGMKRFNPAFDAYESASTDLDRAESEEEIERVKLLGAEQEWKAARRRAGLE